jgi:hypothetical protein
MVAAPYALGTAALAGAWNAIANRDGHQQGATVVGMATGAIAMGTGVAVFTRPGAPRALGVASAAAGALSAMIATRAFFRSRSAGAQNAAREVSVAPVLEPGRNANAGVSVVIRF